MKKIRIFLMSIAVLLSVGAAVAYTENPCIYSQQYYKHLGCYFPAYNYGVEYVCLTSGSVCTYYRPDPMQQDLYKPCKVGSYYVIPW